MAYQLNDKTPIERFWLHVKKTDGCWLWTGHRDYHSYGRFRTGKGTRMFAHRFAWELLRDKIPAGMIICHRCDNPSCVNPEHLFVGTNADNTRDMFQKNRWKRPRNHFLTQCKNSHLYNAENTHISKNGRRRCALCIKMHNRKGQIKKLGGAPSHP